MTAALQPSPQSFAEWAEAFQTANEAERAKLVSGHTLTPKRHRTVLEAVRAGKTLAEAAELAEVTEASVNDWLKRGAVQARGKYREFYEQHNRAAALFTSDLHGGVARTALRHLELPRLYEPHPAQMRLHGYQSDNAFVRILAACAGRRGGKTQGGAGQFAWNIHRDLEHKLLGLGRWEGEPHHHWEPLAGRNVEPFLHYAVIAPTYALLDEPKMALRRYLGLISEGGVIVHQTDHLWWLIGGVRIDFRSGDRPERIVGPGYDGVWVDEAARVKRDVWVDSVRPTLSDTLGWAIFTTTPLGKNWFWEEVWARGDEIAAEELAQINTKAVEDVLDEQYAAVAWTTADNTALPHLAEEMAIARRQLPEAQYRRNYEAGFDAFEGQCFDLLPHKHFVRDVVWTHHALRRIYAGLDPGQTHPTSFSLVGIDGDRIIHELATERESHVDFYGDNAWGRRKAGDRSTWANRLWAALVKVVGEQLWTKVPVYLPHDRDDIKRRFRRYGFYVLDAYQSHEPAVTWMQTAVHNGMVTISSRVLWRCLTNLRFPVAGERSTKLWVDKDDDEWDGFRYALSDLIEHGESPAGVSIPLMGWRAR